MDYEMIKKIIDDFEKNRLIELQIEVDGIKVLMKKQLNITADSANLIQKQSHELPKITDLVIDTYDVKSPIVGVFKTKNSNSQKVFVSLGSKVKKGDILFVIEAMKMFNQVVSPVDGIVEKILFNDGEPIGYNETAIVLRRL